MRLFRNTARAQRVSKPHPILYSVLVLGLSAFCIISAIMGLMSPAADVGELFKGDWEKGAVYEGKTHVAAPEIYYIKHSVNYIIPLGTEHYFFIYNDDASSAVAVRADKSFIDKFDANGGSAEGVEIKGKLRWADSGLRGRIREFTDLYSEVTGETPYKLTDYYLDLLAPRNFILRLIVGLMLAADYFMVVFSLKSGSMPRTREGFRTVKGIFMAVMFTAPVVIGLHLLIFV